MPKPLKKTAKKPPQIRKRKPQADPNKAAHALLAKISASDIEEPAVKPALDFQAQYRAHMAKLGKKGGQKSGRTRKEWLSEERRSEIASIAAKAMWEKRRKKEGGG